jgi:Zn-finger nucleic acid-binding protein
MTDRQGVEIDYCPQCRGVWLDRGELDKIIERSASLETPAPALRPQEIHTEYHKESHPHHPHHKKRKESFLGDLFDF